MDVINLENYIRFLGTAATQPYKYRNASAILFKFRTLRILLDCGENVTRTLLRAKESLDVDVILISHLHGDHFYGLFGLIDTLNKNNRTKPLYIYGPKPILKLIKIHELLYKRFCFSLTVSQFPLTYSLSLAGLDISAYRMVHGTENLGYLFKYIIPRKLDPAKIRLAGLKEGPWCKTVLEAKQVVIENKTYPSTLFLKSDSKTVSIFYSGDTVPVNRDIEPTYLIHECTYYDDVELGRLNKHTCYIDRAKLIRFYNPKIVYLTHISEKFHAMLHKLPAEKPFVFVQDGTIIELEH